MNNECDVGYRSNEAGYWHASVMRPGDAVAVVGISHSIAWDQTTLHAASRVGSDGLVYLVDPVRSHFQDEDWHQPVPTVHCGSVEAYQEELSLLRYKGLPLARTEWLGFESTVHHIPLDDGVVHVVYDHHTSPFIFGKIRTDKRFSFQPFFEKAFAEYYRVVRSGGAIMFQTDLDQMARDWNIDPHALHDAFIGMFGELGCVVEHVFVEDTYRIVVPDEAVGNLQGVTMHCADGEQFGLDDWLMTTEGGMRILKMTNKRHTSPDVYLVIK